MFRGGFLPAFAVIVFSFLGSPLTARSSVDSLVEACYPLIVAELPQQVQGTLSRISHYPRRYLALSYYLRRADEIVDGWSWTSEEVRAYRATVEFDEMVEDVERVRTLFAEANPGYTLRVHIAARSLGTQISKWNSVSSVSRAAHEFLDSVERFARSLLGADSNGVAYTAAEERLDSFRMFLRTYEPVEERAPTVAVPGLSKHGQLRAFDFKVYKGGRMIAGARSRTIPSQWDRPGWTERLREATAAASPRFVGPLPVPYEPWHYNYDPTAPRFGRTADSTGVATGNDPDTE